MKPNTVPQSKLSKKGKSLRCQERRVTWGFSPVSRVKQNRKAYKRKTRRSETNDDHQGN